MYFKLSLRNVRKSLSDYTLYFLTLTFGVCVFYVFNSIEAQKAMMQISESALQVMQNITKFMNGVSVFVSVILGFLIVYANNFLIRRRKREFGIYMTLGMSKRSVSTILITESFFIGIFSLAAGLFAGVFISQGLSVVTAKLFEVDMTDYTFIFSIAAFWKTILYFGIIFLIAVAVSTFAMSKYKLIDLINSVKKNEKQRMRSPVLSSVLFILAVMLIGTAYKLVIKNGIFSFDNQLLFECIIGAVGTFLLFASLSGFLLEALKANRKFYLKGLNMFITRQISSRVNTAYISMSLICLMLFATIGIFSTGIGMTKVLNMGFEDSTPFDVSIQMSGDKDIMEELGKAGINIGDYSDNYYMYGVYTEPEELTLGTLLKNVEDRLPEDKLEGIRTNIYPTPVCLISLSDYNALLALQGKPAVDLDAGEVALATQYIWADANYEDYLNYYVNQGYRLAFNGTEYSVRAEILTEGTQNANSNMLSLIVPDEAIKDGAAAQSVLCFNCRDDSVKTQDEFLSKLNGTGNEDLIYATASKNDILAQKGGSKAIISFVGIYVGVIFLITSAAVLALQQLSEAADNRQRYAILKKIGADNGLLSLAVFKQTAIYFLIPLFIACIHSFVGIKVANEAILEMGSMNALSNILITAVIVLGVYGAYFLATYIGSRNIVLKGEIHCE
jgi:putative ABC transport system permease protein